MSTVKPTTVRETYRINAEVTALTSISHIGESFGPSAKLKREKIIQPDGSVELVPIVSGNSIRGILRDLGMQYMLNKLGNPSLSLPAFYFLFSGGSLTTGGGKQGLDVDLARELQKKIPLIGVLGGAVGNQIIPGRLKCGKLIPVCLETAHILPKTYSENLKQLDSIWAYTQEEAYTRRDDEKNPHLRHLITEKERLLLEAKHAEQRAKRGTDEEIDEEVGQHQQMRYFVETFAAGTKFYWSVGLDDVDRVEFEAFLSCLVQFSKNPVIGGKSAVGHGQVAIKAGEWFSVNPQLINGTEIDSPIGTQYHDHLSENKDSILSILKKFE